MHSDVPVVKNAFVFIRIAGHQPAARPDVYGVKQATVVLVLQQLVELLEGGEVVEAD